MGRNNNQYDVEAREAEKMTKKERHLENPASGIDQGVKTATVDSTTGFNNETSQATQEEGPVPGTIEGARRGTGVVLDKTVKGSVKAATLGQVDVDNFEVKEPEVNSGDTTKITVKIPGT